MKSKIQKKLASRIAKASGKRIKLDSMRLDEIKEAITRADVRGLLKNGAITVEQKKGISRFRAKENRKQKIKGRKKGHGSRKGKGNARSNSKRKWINKVRLQRVFLKALKQAKVISQEIYKDLYKKSKGGFFRSKRHIKLYLAEHEIIKKAK